MAKRYQAAGHQGERAWPTPKESVACQRCGKGTFATIMSYFNTESICLGCEKEEQASPRYEEAKRAENEEVRQGNYNFKGIGGA